MKQKDRLARFGAVLVATVVIGCTSAPAPPAPTAEASASAEPTETATATITPGPDASTTPGTPPPGTSPTPAPSVAPTATASPAPTAVAPDLEATLKHRLFDRFGRLWYCDPDFYPVAREDEASLAERRFPEIQGDAPVFQAIIEYLGLGQVQAFSTDQKLAVYRDWKMLRALQLERRGERYAFDALFTKDESTGVHVAGEIAVGGEITVTSSSPAAAPNCPICLVAGTRIATPAGPVPVEQIRAGMSIWTTDLDGRPLLATVLRTGSAETPADHEVIRIALADGRVLHASPGHPLADGRRLGELRVGDSVDRSTVVTAERVPYGDRTTYDLLPSGPTGAYWAEGVRLASTLR